MITKANASFFINKYNGGFTKMLHFAFACVLLVECVLTHMRNKPNDLFMPDDYGKFVKKAIKGDKEAFGELYKIFLNKIYRFIYYLVGDEFLAEDITQNTFLKAWNSLPNFSLGKGTFQSYLYTIARNLVIDNQRKRKEISLDAEIGNTIASEEDPEKKIWKNESMQKIRETLKSLPEVDRQLVVLRYFEEMQFDEISEILGKKPGALRVRLHRVLETLRVELEGRI